MRRSGVEQRLHVAERAAELRYHVTDMQHPATIVDTRGAGNEVMHSISI